MIEFRVTQVNDELIAAAEAAGLHAFGHTTQEIPMLHPDADRISQYLTDRATRYRAAGDRVSAALTEALASDIKAGLWDA